MSKHSKKLDLNQLAKRIVDEATGETQPEPEIDEKKKAANKEQRLNKSESDKNKSDS